MFKNSASLNVTKIVYIDKKECTITG